MKAIGYIRVSTEEQAKEGISLDNQEAKIKAYCESQDWQLVKVFSEEGSSGKDMRRKGLEKLLFFLEADHVEPNRTRTILVAAPLPSNFWQILYLASFFLQDVSCSKF